MIQYMVLGEIADYDPTCAESSNWSQPPARPHIKAMIYDVFEQLASAST
jgi:hypothetical protein